MTITAVAPAGDQLASTAFNPANELRPDLPSASYLRRQPRWEKCRAVFVGTEAIRAGGEDYLPRVADESDPRYDVRVAIAAFHGFLKRTAQASVGMIMQQEPVLGQDMPAPLVAFAENVDGRGRHLTVFTDRLLQHVVVDGSAGIFTDYARIDPGSLAAAPVSAAAQSSGRLDSAEHGALGLRPYFILVTADDAFQEFYEPLNGVMTLTLFIRREVTEERVRFATRRVVRYYAYERTGDVVTFERWTVPVGGGLPVSDGDPVPMRGVKEIPWSPCDVTVEEQPPLIGLADLNINHHVVNTNIQSLESLACVPTPVRIGAPYTVDDAGNYVYPPLALGPGNTAEAPATAGVGTPIYWLSPDVSVLEPSMRTLDGLALASAKEGGAFLAPDPNGVESGEAKRIKGAAQRATLSTVARTAQDCLERSFGHAGQFMGVTAGSVLINKDFESAVLEPQAMTAFAALLQDGMPVRLAIQALQKGGRIDDSEDPATIEDDWLANRAAAKAQSQIEAQLKADALASGNATPGELAQQPPVAA